MKEIVSNGQASQNAMLSFTHSGVVLGTGPNGQYFNIAPKGYLTQTVTLQGANETAINYRIVGLETLKGITITVDAWDTVNSVFNIKTVSTDTEEYKFTIDIISANKHTITVKNNSSVARKVVLISALLNTGDTGVSDTVNSLSDKMILYGYEKDLPGLSGTLEEGDNA